ncbi:MAG: hypothetical protein INR62_04355 [Rhodospirillales bacterium]|nr:hypothetical protein [Acetobacter sp.]
MTATEKFDGFEVRQCPRCRQQLPGAAWGSDGVCLDCWERFYLLPETAEDRAEAFWDAAEDRVAGAAR